MSRLSRMLRAALAMAAFLLPFSAAPASAGVSVFGIGDFRYSDFYVPPSPLPEGKPGDIIRAEPMDFSRAITKPPTGTVGWKVMYLSTSALGEPMAVTGTVLVRPDQTPAQGKARRPIVTYGNETQGLGDNCAVSRLMTYGHTGELALIEPLIRLGYAVVSSDYEGLGTPSVHTLGVNISAAHAMLDMVRAARQLPDAQLPQDGPLGMFGYSQGGAVGTAGELAPTYAPELTFTAAAFGGAPIDMGVVGKNINGGPASSMLLMALIGMDAAYPELRYADDYASTVGRMFIPTLSASCIEAIPAFAFQWVQVHTRVNPLNDPKWLARIAENRIGVRKIPFPTYYFHAVFDEVMPYSMALQMRTRLCNAGTPLRFSPLLGLEHISAGPQWMPQAAKWLALRLQGRPDAGNCGRLAMPNSIG